MAVSNWSLRTLLVLARIAASVSPAVVRRPAGSAYDAAGWVSFLDCVSDNLDEGCQGGGGVLAFGGGFLGGLSDGDEFFVLGNRDETAGCHLCAATVVGDGTLTLMVRMPDCLAAQHGKYLIIEDVRFACGHEQALAALDSNAEYAACRREHGESAARASGLGQAISYRFKRDKKGWRVFATTQMMDVAVCGGSSPTRMTRVACWMKSELVWLVLAVGAGFPFVLLRIFPMMLDMFDFSIGRSPGAGCGPVSGSLFMSYWMVTLISGG